MTAPWGVRIGAPARRHALVWQARTGLLDALTGQVGTLTRATTGTASDDDGNSYTANHSRPRWHKRSSRVTLRLGGAGGTPVEYLRWTVPLDTVACSLMVEFIENGTVSVSNGGVVSLAKSDFASPRLYICASGGKYTGIHHNGTTDVLSQLAAAPSNGDLVRLRLWAYPNGSVQLWQSINGAAETAATQSGALTFGAAWSNPTRLTLNALGDFDIGVNDYTGLVLARANVAEAPLKAALAG